MLLSSHSFLTYCCVILVEIIIKAAVTSERKQIKSSAENDIRNRHQNSRKKWQERKDVRKEVAEYFVNIVTNCINKVVKSQ